MSQSVNRIFLIGLTIVAVGSLWRAGTSERAKQQATSAFDESQALVRQLQEERTQLDGELTDVRQVVNTQSGEIKGLRQEVADMRRRMEGTATELAALKQEHKTMREREAQLEKELSATVAEKQELEAKLSSLKELRLAIKDVKRKMKSERQAAWRSRVQALRQADQELLASGNRGFIVRDGLPTLGSNVRLHVHVLEPESR